MSFIKPVRTVFLSLELVRFGLGKLAARRSLMRLALLVLHQSNYIIE